MCGICLLLQEGGRELIETILKAYPDDEDIQRSGKSALVSMAALENLSMTAALAAKASAAKSKKAVEEKPVDLLADFRCATPSLMRLGLAR